MKTFRVLQLNLTWIRLTCCLWSLDHMTTASYIPPIKLSRWKVQSNTVLLLLLILSCHPTMPLPANATMADPHQGEMVFSTTAIGRRIRTAMAATWTVGQRPCRVASPAGGIDSYTHQTTSFSVGTCLSAASSLLTSDAWKNSRCLARFRLSDAVCTSSTDDSTITIEHLNSNKPSDQKMPFSMSVVTLAN